MQLKGAERSGYSISVVYADRLLLFALESDISGQVDKEVIKDEIQGRAVYETQAMYVCSTDELDATFKNTVADMDVLILEPNR